MVCQFKKDGSVEKNIKKVLINIIAVCFGTIASHYVWFSRELQEHINIIIGKLREVTN